MFEAAVDPSELTVHREQHGKQRRDLGAQLPRQGNPFDAPNESLGGAARHSEALLA
jgi:hypothetical protein